MTWGAAMIKKKTMWIKPRLRAIQPCQFAVAPHRALPISRAGVDAGGRPKGGGRGRH